MVTSLSLSAKDEIQRKLDEAVQAKKAPGLVFGVSSSTGELFWAQSGLRKADNSDEGPITPDSVFMICSQTKMITAIAAFQLIEAGKLALDTPAAEILPELANPVIVDEATGTHRPASGQILIRHLLNHTSGLFYGDELRKTGLTPPGYLASNLAIERGITRPEMIKGWFRFLKGDLPGVPLKFEPGTSWEYGYSKDVLGFIVETVTGQSLEEVFKTKIFEPLGMSSTSFYLTPELEKRYVELAVKTPEGQTVPYNDQFPITERDPKKLTLLYGGGGLFSTPKDYMALERHLLQILNGTAQNPILKAESLRLFFEPSLSPEGSKGMDDFFRLAPPGQQHGLGLGVAAADKGPKKRRKGTGYWGGWAGTSHYIDPQTGIAVYAGLQLVPPLQAQLPIVMLWETIEPILYQGLVTSKL